MLSTRGAGARALRRSCSHPGHPAPAAVAALRHSALHPLHLSVQNNFKMEAKTHYTSDRHAHTCTRRPAEAAGRQLHSESTKECIRSPSWRRGAGPGPLVLSPQPWGTAAGSRGWREGSASLVGGPGAREAAQGTGRTEADPQPQEPEGSNSQALTLEGFKGLGLGGGLLGPASPQRYACGKPRSQAGPDPSTPLRPQAQSRSAWASKPLALAWEVGDQGLP